MKIKRPLFIIALSVLVVIYSINTLPASVLYCSLALFILFTVIHRFTTDRYTPHLVLFLLAALIGAGWFSVFKNNLNHKINNLAQLETVTVSGVVTNKDSIGYTNCYHIDLDSVNNENIRNFKVVVYADEYLEEGDKVVSSGKLKGFTAKSDYQYNYSKGVFAYFYPEKLEKQAPESNFTAVFNQIRTVLIDNARKIFSHDTVSTAIAMGLGEKYLLDYSAKEAFASTGISHALVVSGLHIGFITAVLKCLMYLLPIHKKVKNIILCCFAVLFMALIGFTPSIVRAGCLIIAITLGRTFLVETDNFTVLAIIVLLTLIVNPYSAVNSSLLLSYTAYFGVIKGAEICADRNYGKIKSTFITTVFAVLFTTPVMCMLGMDMTLLSPLFNVLLIYVIMVICVLSFFLPLLVSVPLIGLHLAGFVAPLNDICIRFLLRFTEFVQNNFSFAVIDLSTDIIKVFVFALLVAIVIAFIQFTDKRKRVILIFAVSIISVLCYNFMNKGTVTVKVFDGSSEPSYIIYAEDKIYLLATENINSITLKNQLEDIKINQFDEIMVCTHKDADTDMYSQYTDKVTVISDTEHYTNGVVTLDTYLKNRQMACVADIRGVTIGFNHNKADMSGKNLDLYFFGSSAPKDVEASEYYYFYPVIKSNVDLVTEKQAKELYDILEIKIKNGKYYIMEDVKNFGSGI